jgi:hypothetical protein
MYLGKLSQNRIALAQWYHELAYLMDDDRVSMLQGLAQGLESVVFALEVDDAGINGVNKFHPKNMQEVPSAPKAGGVGGVWQAMASVSSGRSMSADMADAPAAVVAPTASGDDFDAMSAVAAAAEKHTKKKKKKKKSDREPMIGEWGEDKASLGVGVGTPPDDDGPSFNGNTAPSSPDSSRPSFSAPAPLGSSSSYDDVASLDNVSSAPSFGSVSSQPPYVPFAAANAASAASSSASLSQYGASSLSDRGDGSGGGMGDANSGQPSFDTESYNHRDDSDGAGHNGTSSLSDVASAGLAEGNDDNGPPSPRTIARNALRNVRENSAASSSSPMGGGSVDMSDAFGGGGGRERGFSGSGSGGSGGGGGGASSDTGFAPDDLRAVLVGVMRTKDQLEEEVRGLLDKLESANHQIDELQRANAELHERYATGAGGGAGGVPQSALEKENELLKVQLKKCE